MLELKVNSVVDTILDAVRGEALRALEVGKVI